MIALLLALLATAAEPGDLERALVDSLERQEAELSLGEEAAPIYHLRYHLMSLEQVDVLASMGDLVRDDVDPYRMLSVELRVGEPNFDNTGFGGWENGFGFAWLPRELTPHALRMAAWRLTDTAYKQALEQYSRKAAQFRPPEDYPGDYTLADAVVARSDVPPPADPEPLKALARRLSAVFAGKPGVERGEVYIGHESGSHTLVDSGGHRLVRPISETSIRAVLHVRADDGMLLTDSRLWSVRSPDDLPSPDVMQADVETMTEELLTLAAAPVLDEEVVGPVVFHDGAAIDLFRLLLLPQLEGTPPEVPFDTWLGELGSGAGNAVRMGRRVLPPGWAVSDDPMADPSHPAAYTHDYEGTPAQAVDLVQDGIVRDVLMSRVPRKDRSESNGHARGSLRQRLSGRNTLATVTPSRNRSRARLNKRALKLASAYGRDWYLRVDRLQEPAVRDLGGGGGFFGGDEETLPRPVQLTRVYADGREERLRGARFAAVQRFALRDIAEAGPQVTGTFFLPSEPGEGLYAPTGGLPTRLTAPEVLVGELEMVPTPADPNDVPLIPHPATLAAH